MHRPPGPAHYPRSRTFHWSSGRKYRPSRRSCHFYWFLLAVGPCGSLAFPIGSHAPRPLVRGAAGPERPRHSSIPLALQRLLAHCPTIRPGARSPALADAVAIGGARLSPRADWPQHVWGADLGDVSVRELIG